MGDMFANGVVGYYKNQLMLDLDSQYADLLAHGQEVELM